MRRPDIPEKTRYTWQSMPRHPDEIADRPSLLVHERVAQRLAESPSIRVRARERAACASGIATGRVQ